MEAAGVHQVGPAAAGVRGLALAASAAGRIGSVLAAAAAVVVVAVVVVVGSVGIASFVGCSWLGCVVEELAEEGDEKF